MWLALVIQLVSAYVFAFVFYTLFLVFTKVAKWKIITVACVIIIAISFVVVLVKSKKKNAVLVVRIALVVANKIKKFYKLNLL